MIHRPPGMGAFQFVVLSKLRAAQLVRGCRPLVDGGTHKAVVTAQVEVAEGKVAQVVNEPANGESTGVPLVDEAVVVQGT